MLINPNNKLELKRAELYFKKLVDLGVCFELKRKTKKRSISINAYLHVCIDLYAINFGYSKDEAKTYLKRKCNFMAYEKKGSCFLKQTSKLDNKECSQFVEWIRNFSALNGCYIPTSEEYITNQFEIDKEINKHKEFL